MPMGIAGDIIARRGGSEKSLSVNGKAETYKDFNPVGTITIEEE